MSENRKGKRVDRSGRRYTIDFGKYEDEMVLVEDTDETENEVYASVQTSEAFVQSATQNPDEWRDGLKRIVESVRNARVNYRTLADQHEQLGREAAEFKAKYLAQSRRQKEVDRAYQEAKEVAARLRHLRDKWRSEAEESQKENEELKAKLKERSLPARNRDEDFDSDDERFREPGHQRGRVSLQPNSHRQDQRYTPATDRTEGVGNKKRYPDVPNFHGTHDRDDWESGYAHLLEKFHQSAVIFPTEKEKIGYVRDLVKYIVFDVIKTRAMPNAVDPYDTADEMVQELDNMFGNYDQIAHSNDHLHDPKFGMVIVDKQESFEKLYARFSAAIAPLGFDDYLKISNLTRLLVTRLKYRVSGQTFMSYTELVQYLRKLDLDLRAVDVIVASQAKEDEGGVKTSVGRSDKTPSSNNQRPSSSRNANIPSTNSKPRGYKYQKPVVDRIRKEGRCFKYLQPGHHSSDDNAPCKNANPLTKEQVEVTLKSVDVEGTDEIPELPGN